MFWGKDQTFSFRHGQSEMFEAKMLSRPWEMRVQSPGARCEYEIQMWELLASCHVVLKAVRLWEISGSECMKTGREDKEVNLGALQHLKGWAKKNNQEKNPQNKTPQKSSPWEGKIKKAPCPGCLVECRGERDQGCQTLPKGRRKASGTFGFESWR